MNKIELYSDLSFNDSTDFESLLMESMIDDAECEVAAARCALEEYLGVTSVSTIESMIFALESDKDDECECDDDDDDDVEDAEESYLREAYEGAISDFGHKMAASWKSFIEKMKAFMSRLAEAFKNIVAKFNTVITSARAKNDIQIAEKHKRYLDLASTIKNQFDKIDYDKAQELSALFEDEKEDRLGDDRMVTVSANDVKKYMSDISGALKAASSALKKVDKEVNQAIKEGDPAARSNMAEVRAAITAGMQRLRLVVSYVSVAVGKANKEASAIKAAGKRAERRMKADQRYDKNFGKKIDRISSAADKRTQRLNEKW